MHTLHLIDPTTPRDGMDLLAQTVAPDDAVLVLGHAKFLRAALRCGVPGDLLTHVHCMGWADVSTWRAVRQIVAAAKPAALHAWGVRGIAAAPVDPRHDGQRFATFAGPINPAHHRVLRMAQKRGPWAFTVTSAETQRTLLEAGLRNVELASSTSPVVEIRGFGPRTDDSPADTKAPPFQDGAKKRLGLRPDDGPIILLGGEHEPAARHDIALWAAGILAQLYSGTRVIARSEDEWSRRLPSPARLFAARMPLSRGGDPLTVFAPPEMSWPELLQLADVLLITPDGPISTGCIAAALAAGVPIVATDVECVRERVENGRTGLLAKPRDPRAIAACLEEFMSEPAQI